MGVKAPMEMEMKPTRELPSDDTDDICPDSWEMADLEESMKRLLPAGCSLKDDGYTRDRNFVSGGSGDATQLDEFLREALQNPSDRLTILRLEQEVEKFVRNLKQHQLEFPPMASSYMRLAVHRVAQHYHLLTSVMDSSCAEGGCRIIVRKSGENRFPSVRLADIPVATEGGGGGGDSSTKFVIKQRPQAMFMSSGDGGGAGGSGTNPSKTVEERNEEYNRARARIFRHEMEQRAYEELVEAERVESSRKSLKQADASDHAAAVTSGKRGNNNNNNNNNSSSSSSSSKAEKEKDQSGKSRQKVAIFRDREKDRKDPDYDRNYDRYSQRFDPGFGLNQPAFGMQARYTPVVNYNTEFPQLGCPPVRPMPPPPAGGQAVQGWYHQQQSQQQQQQQHQEMLRTPFNTHPRGVVPPPPHSNMATYMSQYPYSRPSVAAYPYASSQVPQSEASSAQARRH